jgi:E3 ubiquitin-protein ligase SHPRH
MDALNKELSIFRSAYNKRGYYFAALQEISDTVRDPEFKDSHDLQRQVDGTATEIDTVMQRLQEARVRSRFLTALGNKDGDNQGAIEAVAQKENPKDDCVICYGCSDDLEGLLLGCGHFFCKACHFSSGLRAILDKGLELIQSVVLLSV